MNRRLLAGVWLVLVVLPLGVSESVLSLFTPPARANAGDVAFTNAGFVAHQAQLEKKVPKGFTVIVQPPFVVIGDESPETVRRRATNKVKWAVDKLKLDYFKRDPAEIIDIWLFRDRVSYTNHARLLYEFVANVTRDPTGYKTLKRVLGEDDMETFRRKWEKFVLELRSPLVRRCSFPNSHCRMSWGIFWTDNRASAWFSSTDLFLANDSRI